VKPENVMVREDGYVKVLDCGLAKPAARPQPARPSDTAPTVLITDPGIIMGTVSYMSPEQARGDEVDQRSDIFSLGVVLYEMVTGHRPFRGETVSHTMVAILEHEPAPLSRYAPETPADRVINKLGALAGVCRSWDDIRTVQELSGIRAWRRRRPTRTC
jgi:serine/threonine-protein kinase